MGLHEQCVRIMPRLARLFPPLWLPNSQLHATCPDSPRAHLIMRSTAEAQVCASAMPGSSLPFFFLPFLPPCVESQAQSV